MSYLPLPSLYSVLSSCRSLNAFADHEYTCACTAGVLLDRFSIVHGVNALQGLCYAPDRAFR